MAGILLLANSTSINADSKTAMVEDLVKSFQRAVVKNNKVPPMNKVVIPKNLSSTRNTRDIY